MGEPAIDTLSCNVRELDDAAAARWDGYVAGAPEGSVYHLAMWRGLIEALFGHKGLYLYAEDEAGAIRGVLPMVRIKSRLFGHYMVSMPYFNYGGALADGDAVDRALMAAAAAAAAEQGVAHIEFRDVSVLREHWPVRSDKITMILDLPDQVEALWKAIGSKVRAQIKRPQRENPDVRFGGAELLDDFYRVFAVNMRDLGTPVYPKRFFQRMLASLPDNAGLVTIYLDGEPVGGAFLLGYRGRLEIPWASTLRRVNRLGINMLMYWEVLRFAIERGYTQFDFGRCTEGSGTHRFKKQWGAQPRQLHWHYWLKNGGELPALTPDNPKYRLAIALWQKMPVALTRVLGPPIVKNLP
jgi:FemAB-related protein (PEP-CTERM system-associated)